MHITLYTASSYCCWVAWPARNSDSHVAARYMPCRRPVVNVFVSQIVSLMRLCHWTNAGTLRMVPLRINPIYTSYNSGYLLGISPFKGLLGGLGYQNRDVSSPTFVNSLSIPIDSHQQKTFSKCKQWFFVFSRLVLKHPFCFTTLFLGEGQI